MERLSAVPATRRFSCIWSEILTIPMAEFYMKRIRSILSESVPSSTRRTLQIDKPGRHLYNKTYNQRSPPMDAITYSAARASLASTMDPIHRT